MNVIQSADLWFPGYPLGVPNPTDAAWYTGHKPRPDPTRYVVWVDPGRGNDEQAPRQALHVGVAA